MNWSDQFTELDRKTHDRDSFDCGKQELNDFIRTRAVRHMAAGVSTTRLLPVLDLLPNGKHPICAFYTVTPCTINRTTLPKASSLPKYPVPVFLIAQLAIDEKYQGQGLGRITLVNSLEYLWKVNSQMRAHAVIVDCLDDEAERFYRKYGFEFLCEHNHRNRLFMPMNTIGELFKQ